MGSPALLKKTAGSKILNTRKLIFSEKQYKTFYKSYTKYYNKKKTFLSPCVFFVAIFVPYVVHSSCVLKNNVYYSNQNQNPTVESRYAYTLYS